MMSFNCPDCQSENTQKLSLLVHGGTLNVNSTTVGAGMSGGGLGVGAGSTRGTSTSQLAEQHAEPKKGSVVGTFFAVLLVALIIAIFAGQIAFYIGLGLAFFAAWGIHSDNASFPEKHAAWDKRFICMRCSNVFVPAQWR